MSLHQKTEPDLWLANAKELYALDEVQLRVRAKAARLAAECTRMRNSGRNVPILEVEDFICHAWILALKNRPDFPDRMGMVLFFWRRMENLFKDKCKKSAASKTYSISLDGDADEPATHAEISVLSFEKHHETHRERENADALRGFQAYLSLNASELLPLYSLMIREQIDSPREQAQRLHLEVKDIYRLRARLQLQAKHYGSALKTKS
jgi:DNA-directed RNA polymerase specialized sigma24 family protein